VFLEFFYRELYRAIGTAAGGKNGPKSTQAFIQIDVNTGVYGEGANATHWMTY